MNEELEQKLVQAKAMSESAQNEEARTLLLEVLEQDPANQTAMLMLGGEYFCAERLAEAEMVFLRLVSLAPEVGQFSIALFNTLWKQGKQTDAIEEIRRFMAEADKVAEKETIDQYVAITRGLMASAE